MTTVLIADDNVKIVDVLSEYLKAEGFDTLTALDGSTAAVLASTHSPDIALIDVMLPGIDGLELTRMLLGENIPVIIVSARTSETDRLKGLDIGADDYVTKPFSPREVVARVRSVLRRASHGPEHPSVITIGGIEIDVDRHEAVVDGRVVELTKTEFDMLLTLAEQPGRVLTRLELLGHTSGEVPEGYERTVDAHIKNIRRKLGETSRDHIKTVFGVGYKLKP